METRRGRAAAASVQCHAGKKAFVEITSKVQSMLKAEDKHVRLQAWSYAKLSSSISLEVSSQALGNRSSAQEP